MTGNDLKTLLDNITHRSVKESPPMLLSRDYPDAKSDMTVGEVVGDKSVPGGGYYTKPSARRLYELIKKEGYKK